MAVHQFVPMLHRNDAVGRHTLELRDLLRNDGVESEVYVELDDPETVSITKRAVDYRADARRGDVLVYQFATSSALTDLLTSRGESLVVNYHNITPPEFFAPWDNPLARHQVRAQQELRGLAPRAALGVAVSQFNRADLVAAGYRLTAVVPPIVHLEGFPPKPTSRSKARADTLSGARWLSVGRLVPNKSLEDTLLALMCYRKLYDPDATLRIIGRSSLRAYARALRRFVAELGLSEAVTFEEKVSDERLAAAYGDSDVLVVLSEHEGFCLPVVEAMAHRLPVVALFAGAIPEVLGDAGVVVGDKSPGLVADSVRRVLSDKALRRRLAGASENRLEALGIESAGPRLAALVMALHNGTPSPGDVGLEPAGVSLSGGPP